MPLKILQNNRGMALLITITIITLLVTVALELNRKVRSAVVSSAVSRDRITLSQMASSGIHAAMAMLVKDKVDSISDSLQEDWADSEKIMTLLQSLSFEDGNINLKIIDELGKIQVNALVKFPESHQFNEAQRILWDRFLRGLMPLTDLPEDFEPTSIINCLKDWIDSGDDDAITGLTGAESDYYQGLDPPYSCRNAPLPHLSELAMVKGIPQKLFYGDENIYGFSNYMTIYGMQEIGDTSFAYEGKININTAELPVLTAILPSENADLAQAIYEYRQETEDLKYIHDLSNITWYKNVPGCSDLEIDPEIITTSSDYFRIESEASLNKIKMVIIAFVKREKDNLTGKWNCKVLRWQSE
ncbi:MAG: general secretion pathway protein GspK [Desulfobacterales bacterium]|nr:general secretion pathway protein GspK [Desulfobacterales bacterium]